MSDRREEILRKNVGLIPFLSLEKSIDQIYNAMDEYMRECCLELLQFIAENKVEGSTKNEAAKTIEDPVFYYKGEWVTKEWLFEEFL